MGDRVGMTLCLSMSLVSAGCASHPPGFQPVPTSIARPAVLPSTPGFPEYPTLSPDGGLVVFSWAGDLWCAAATGGAATRLTVHPADETRSAFSPDGSRLAFESTRDGSRNLYEMELVRVGGAVVAGGIRRVTNTDRAQTLSGYNASGDALMFSGSAEPSIYRHARMYVAPISGGPTTRLSDAYGIEPAMARDGSVVAFTRGGNSPERPAYNGSGDRDIFTFTPSSGEFRQLTTWDGNDFSPFPLPDGSIVFVSARDGQNNIYRLASGRDDAGQRSPASITQLTRFALGPNEGTIGHGVRDLNISRDGSTAVFCVWDTMYTLDLGDPGSAPRAVSVNVGSDTDDLDYLTINVAQGVDDMATSPDGQTVAVISRGDVFVRSSTKDHPTRRVTATPGREVDLAWSPDGRFLYFASDETGEYELYRAEVALARSDISPKQEEEPAEEKKPDDKGKAEEPAGGEPATEPAQPSDPAKAEEGNGEEKKADDKPKEKKPEPGKRWAESLTYKVERLLPGVTGARTPLPSPDGRRMLFTRVRGDLHLLDLKTLTHRVVFESWDEPSVSWASDSRHIVYSVADLYFNSDVFLLDVDAEAGATLSKPFNVSRHPDLDTNPRLSEDGKVLYFTSDRGPENFNFNIYAVFLDTSLEGMTDYDLAAHFKKAAEKSKKNKPIDQVDFEKEHKPAKPLEFDLDDAYLRVRSLVRSDSSTGNLQITPAGDRVMFSASMDGPPAYHSVDHTGGDRKQVTSGGVSRVHLSPSGDAVYFLKSGTPNSSTPTGGKSDTYPVSGTVRLSVADEQRQKFTEAARVIRDNFYHPTLKDLGWEQITRRYIELATATRTSSAFNRIGNMLFGELDGSHLGMSGGPGYSGPGSRTGYLGIDASPVGNGYRVDVVISDMPAARESSKLNVGDVITAINGVAISQGGAMKDLSASMEGTSGVETLLSVLGPDGAERMVLITPASSGADSNARYQHEVLRRAARVKELSGGRLGYLHIRGMSMPSVNDYERDLFAAADGKDGLIIDVRDNGGGSTADILLSSLTAPRHAYTIPRGANAADVPFDAYPRDRRLIYPYVRPISVLINENSFSNAEIFAHSIKTIGRGKLVGTPTFGGVISTGGTSLIDGTSVRLPFRGWYLPDGTDMEENGAQPDINVPQEPADEARGLDAQLDAAVRELLSRVDAEKK